MTHDGIPLDDERSIQLALWRYQLIAELVEREDLAHGEVTRIVREVAEREHYRPGQGPVRVSERTVYAYLARYRGGGIEALAPRRRKDAGVSRVLSEALIQRAVELRREAHRSPADARKGDDVKNTKGRWTRSILDMLRLEGRLGDPPPHRSTLDRHLAARGASRRQLALLGARRTIKMQFDAFGDLWVGDYHHGPLVATPAGGVTTAKLGAFIDHHTRYPVAHRYYLDEQLASLRDSLLRALLTWGLPRKVYVDRGAVYRADELAYSLDRLECRLVHSRAYYSQGRGVIERWWQHADQFEQEVRLRGEPPTIHELNRFWEAYCTQRYLRAVHSELKKTPEQAIAGVVKKPLDPAVAAELFLVGARRKVHKKDACVRVEGRAFLCESFLRGRWVTVRYDPADLSSVLIFHEGKRLGRAFPQVPNATPEPHEGPPEDPRSSIDYLALLRDEFDEQLLAHARPLAYTELKAEPGFDGEAFTRVVCELAGLTPRKVDRQELATFWNRYAPIPEDLVRVGVEHAVRLHGRRRHLRVYLHAVRTLVLAHWKTPDKEASS